MSFEKWLNKLDCHSRAELLEELLDRLSMDELADVINERADNLNDLGYDWGVFRDVYEIRESK